MPINRHQNIILVVVFAPQLKQRDIPIWNFGMANLVAFTNHICQQPHPILLNELFPPNRHSLFPTQTDDHHQDNRNLVSQQVSFFQ